MPNLKLEDRNQLHRAAIRRHLGYLNHRYGTEFKEEDIAKEVIGYWNDYKNMCGEGVSNMSNEEAFNDFFKQKMLQLQSDLLDNIYSKVLNKSNSPELTVYPSVYSHKINELLIMTLEAYTDYTKENCAGIYQSPPLHMQILEGTSPSSSWEAAKVKHWVPNNAKVVISKNFNRSVADLGNYVHKSTMMFQVLGNLQLAAEKRTGKIEPILSIPDITNDEREHKWLDEYDAVPSREDLEQARKEKSDAIEQERINRQIAYNNDERRIAEEQAKQREEDISKSLSKRNPFPRLPLNSDYSGTPVAVSYIKIDEFNQKYGTAIQLEGLINAITNLDLANLQVNNDSRVTELIGIYWKIFTAGATAIIDDAITSQKDIDGLDFTKLAIDTTNLLELICSEATRQNPKAEDALSHISYGVIRADTGFIKLMQGHIETIIEDAKKECLSKNADHKFVCDADKPALEQLETKENQLLSDIKSIDAKIENAPATYTQNADNIYDSYKIPTRVPTSTIVSESIEKRTAYQNDKNNFNAKHTAIEAAYVLEKRIERRYGWWLPKVFRAVSYFKCKNELDALKRDLSISPETKVSDALLASQYELYAAEKTKLTGELSDIHKQRQAIYDKRTEKLFKDKTQYQLILGDKARSMIGYLKNETGIAPMVNLNKLRFNQLKNYSERKVEEGNTSFSKLNWGDFGPKDDPRYNGALLKSPYEDEVMDKNKFIMNNTSARSYMTDEEKRLFDNQEINPTKPIPENLANANINQDKKLDATTITHDLSKDIVKDINSNYEELYKKQRDKNIMIEEKLKGKKTFNKEKSKKNTKIKLNKKVSKNLLEEPNDVKTNENAAPQSIENIIPEPIKEDPPIIEHNKQNLIEQPPIEVKEEKKPDEQKPIEQPIEVKEEEKLDEQPIEIEKEKLNEQPIEIENEKLNEQPIEVKEQNPIEQQPIEVKEQNPIEQQPIEVKEQNPIEQQPIIEVNDKNEPDNSTHIIFGEVAKANNDFPFPEGMEFFAKDSIQELINKVPAVRSDCYNKREAKNKQINERINTLEVERNELTKAKEILEKQIQDETIAVNEVHEEQQKIRNALIAKKTKPNKLEKAFEKGIKKAKLDTKLSDKQDKLSDSISKLQALEQQITKTQEKIDECNKQFQDDAATRAEEDIFFTRLDKMEFNSNGKLILPPDVKMPKTLEEPFINAYIKENALNKEDSRERLDLSKEVNGNKEEKLSPPYIQGNAHDAPQLHNN